MSWLLENWFRSEENLEKVREEINKIAHKEVYLGVSGMDRPELSFTKVESKELTMTLPASWENTLEEAEVDLLQFIHDELPPIVRDELGVIPFYTSVLSNGYLMLAFVRNSGIRRVGFKQLPLSLVTSEGEVIAHKVFEMEDFQNLPGMTSRPCELMFRWEDFARMPQENEELSLLFDAPVKKKEVKKNRLVRELSDEEMAYYEKVAKEQPPVADGVVEATVLDMQVSPGGSVKVVVLFRNGLDENLEFNSVPILIHDQSGEEVARLQYKLKNLKVAARDNRIWGFFVPAESLKKFGVDPTVCTARVPLAIQKGSNVDDQGIGPIQ